MPPAYAPKPRVLIIEDDHNACRTVCKLLENRGIDAECAGDLNEGLAAVRAGHQTHRPYACVVLDLGLPHSTPEETVGRASEFGRTPLVVMSGNDDREILRKLIALEIPYVAKPVEAHILMEHILVKVARSGNTTQIMERVLENQREAVQAAKEEQKPWILKWAPAVSATVACLVFILAQWRGIVADIQEEHTGKARMVAVERAQADFRDIIARMQSIQGDLVTKAEKSIDDRANLHRELGVLDQRQRELKEDVIRRLERIEDKIDRRGQQ